MKVKILAALVISVFVIPFLSSAVLADTYEKSCYYEWNSTDNIGELVTITASISDSSGSSVSDSSVVEVLNETMGGTGSAYPMSGESLDIQITSPANGTEVSGNTNITISAAGSNELGEMSLSIEGNQSGYALPIPNSNCVYTVDEEYTKRPSPCCQYGDLTADGYVTQEDITELENCIAGAIGGDICDLGDVNDDGSLDALDVTKMERYIEGEDSTFSVCEEHKDVPCENYGDLNTDDCVDSEDVDYLEKVIGGEYAEDEYVQKYADVNNDSELNALDITQMERYIEGEDSTFPVCEQINCNTHYIEITDVDNTSGNLSISYKTQETGDNVNAQLIISEESEQGGGAGAISCGVISVSCGATSDSSYMSCSVNTDCDYPDFEENKTYTVKLIDNQCSDISDTYEIQEEEEPCEDYYLEIIGVRNKSGNISVDYKTEEPGADLDSKLIVYQEGGRGAGAIECGNIGAGCSMARSPDGHTECSLDTDCNYPDFEEGKEYSVKLTDKQCSNVSDTYEIQEEETTCTDSDGGRNYYEKGKVTVCSTQGNATGCGVSRDSCVHCTGFCPVGEDCPEVTCNAVEEYYCEGGEAKKEMHTCPNNCLNGSCIEGERPYCGALGTRSEGWYQKDAGLIEYDNCDGCYAVCRAIGTRSEGWYSSCTGELIKYGWCGSEQPDSCEDMSWEECTSDESNCWWSTCGCLPEGQGCDKKPCEGLTEEECTGDYYSDYCWWSEDCNCLPTHEGCTVVVNVTEDECPVGCDCSGEKIICEEVPDEQEVKCERGCKLNDRCVSYGTRAKIENKTSYCSLDGEWKSQKEDDEPCQNNYECRTNFCSEGRCYNIKGELQETQSLLQKILDFFRKLFG